MYEFRALLSDVITPEVTAQNTEDAKTPITSWSTAKRLLKTDPRYARMPRKERESLWRRHVEEIQRRQKKLAVDQEVGGVGEKKYAETSRRSADFGKYRGTHD